MEASSLIKAHDHARAASLATQTADTTVAVNEHTLAAGEFSNAAKSTTSVEALRTLKLLEQHHRRLSELLKYPLEHPVQHLKTDGDGADASEKAAAAASDAGPGITRQNKQEAALASDGASKAAAPAASSSQQRRYPPARELSSSIASNLASARGIRSKYRGQPLAPSVSNDQAPGNLEGNARKDGSRAQMQSVLQQKGKPSWVPPTQGPPAAEGSRHVEIELPKVEESPSASQSDDGFSRFYNTFGSLINRLSAPLAFAGLPLIAEEPDPEPPVQAPEPQSQRRNRMKASQMAGAEPELSKIYSKAALRAIARDGHGAHESFYVVPKTGHTASYANILSFDQKEKRRMAASLHGDDDLAGGDLDDDDFVDAKESQVPHSPAFNRRLGKMLSDKEARNVIEELYTENQSLKDMLDKVSKRLHAFESNAQQSHMALQESIRFMRPGSPLSSSGGGRAGAVTAAAEESLRKKNKELEEELAVAVQRMDVLEKERRDMEKTLHKYRNMWEKLKAGAKARREAQGQGAADSGGESSKAVADT